MSTSKQHTAGDQTQARPENRAAALARSILSCPIEVDLVVDGVAHPLADDSTLPMQDLAGVPTFACRPDGVLARAGQAGLPVVITVRSGLGTDGSPERDASLAVAGRLRRAGGEYCDCCDEVRDRLVVDIDLVQVTCRGTRTAVPVEEFLNPAYHLNAGYLQRAVEHANGSHQEELRYAVAQRTNQRPRHIVAVRLADLTCRSVEVQWVTADGGNRTVLRFPTTASTPEELGDLLRKALHPGLC